MSRGAWWATIHGVENELDTTELNNKKVELKKHRAEFRLPGFGDAEEEESRNFKF